VVSEVVGVEVRLVEPVVVIVEDPEDVAVLVAVSVAEDVAEVVAVVEAVVVGEEIADEVWLEVMVEVADVVAEVVKVDVSVVVSVVVTVVVAVVIRHSAKVPSRTESIIELSWATKSQLLICRWPPIVVTIEPLYPSVSLVYRLRAATMLACVTRFPCSAFSSDTPSTVSVSQPKVPCEESVEHNSTSSFTLPA